VDDRERLADQRRDDIGDAEGDGVEISGDRDQHRGHADE